MKFGNDSSVTVKNDGENHGVEIGVNYGPMVIKQGLGYNDTKELCYEIVRDEIAKYHAEALGEAQKRNDELFERVVQKLKEENMDDAQTLAEFRNPAMQFDYLEAQKAYIKAGTPELSELLSDILVKRISESSRSLLQISLGEAIHVVPKLIQSQIASLALAFIIKHTRQITVNSHATFAAFIKDTIIPIFCSGVSKKDSEFQHLSFTGCGQQSVLSNNMIDYFKSNYAGLFMRGISQSDIPKDENDNNLNDIYPDLFIRCLNNTEMFQINAISKDDLTQRIKPEQKYYDILMKLFDENIMSDEDAQKLVEDLVPEMKDIFTYWNDSGINSCILSSVGIVIGAEYAHQITGQDYDLHIWI
mgnify:CR=1 FL=1